MKYIGQDTRPKIGIFIIWLLICGLEDHCSEDVCYHTCKEHLDSVLAPKIELAAHSKGAPRGNVRYHEHLIGNNPTHVLIPDEEYINVSSSLRLYC